MAPQDLRDTSGAGDTHGAEGQRPHHPVLLPGVHLVEVLVRHEDGPVPALTKAVDLWGQGQMRGHVTGVTKQQWPGRTPSFSSPSPCGRGRRRGQSQNAPCP